MLSFRTAQDHTYIAQLIGRMVRTPLARRVATDDVLNTVALYLPYYDDKEVAQVVAGLMADESRLTPRIEVDPVICMRNRNVPPAVWEFLNSTPSYTRPARNHRNEVARLNALAVLLVGNKLDATAMDTARNHLVDTLTREARRIGKALKSKVRRLEELVYQTQSVDLSTGLTERESGRVRVNARNIEDLFRRARRTLGDAAATWYWDDLVDGQGIDADEAKLRIAVIAEDSTVAPALELAAKSLIDSWRTEHNSAINDLPDAKRAAFYTVWQQARSAQQVTMIMPTQVTAPEKDKRHPHHIYANGKGFFPMTFTGWEADVLEAELAKNELVAWYRNPSSGTAALAVPYMESGTARTCYPDFLFFHEVDGEQVVDIVDPHRPSFGDTGPKWSGLADYAVQHGSLFRRILAVIKDTDDVLVSLDMKNPQVAKRMAKATNETDIRKIFRDFGGPY